MLSLTALGRSAEKVTRKVDEQKYNIESDPATPEIRRHFLGRMPEAHLRTRGGWMGPSLQNTPISISIGQPRGSQPRKQIYFPPKAQNGLSIGLTA
jgi:hypothetical protein